MISLKFNKNITKTKDALSHTLLPKGYENIRMVNVFFSKGYKEVSQISFLINDVPFNLSLKIRPMDNPDNTAIFIDTNLYFKNSPIILKANGSIPFDFSIVLQYN